MMEPDTPSCSHVTARHYPRFRNPRGTRGLWLGSEGRGSRGAWDPAFLTGHSAAGTSRTLGSRGVSEPLLLPGG